MSNQIERILSKAKAQGLFFDPVLSIHDVEVFEQAKEIRLPEGYKEYLLQIGDGGDGPPTFGLCALGHPPCDMQGEEWLEWHKLPHVREEFPFTAQWIWENDELTDEGSRDQVGHGSICLGTDGCAIYWHLIVTGPERGNVWMICGEGIQPTCPKRDFLTWFEDWLDGKDSFYGFSK